ncbi:YfhO family protein [Chitinophaga qingshengii]|uniref:YfhO family protein n=1 Tax=Chitinophaga qingshengii TaxID=1569794 RepID=A0ABR7TNK2_9BACT|nr:YfhO family protein [Chitinophaga qingshengii]MBC9932056.1 YfhO family protein [Chitinophaga qingshengii]
MNKHQMNTLLRHLAAVAIFAALALLFCSPVLDGKALFQSDMMHHKGMQQEALNYYNTTGEIPMWTNSMFGGMPTYVIFTGPPVSAVWYLNKLFTLWLPNPADMLFVNMLGMYLLLSILDFRYWIRILGAVAYGFATFSVVSMETGHITKVMAMAYMAPVLAGIILTYRGKWIAGACLTAITTSLLVYNNHLQITYYTLIMVMGLAISSFVTALRAKQLPSFFKASALLAVAAVLAILPNMDNLMVLKEYTRYTIRGSESELTRTQQDKAGLDVAYAFQWSYGPGETFTMLLPGVVGNSTSEKLSARSHTYKALTSLGVPAVQAEQAVNSGRWPLYWAGQPMTAGPVYVGVIICLLTVLSLLIIRSPHKWWWVAVAGFAILLSWGYNFAPFNNFLFYHLPLYNKFRAPTMALAIPQVSFVVLACWALQELMSGKQSKAQLMQGLQKATVITGGLVVGIAIFGSFIFSFSGPNDASILQQYTQMMGSKDAANTLMAALKKDRSSLLLRDGFRALILLSIAYGVMWAYLKDKLKALPVLLVLVAVVSFDLIQVDRHYMNEESFWQPDQLASYMAPTAADEQILQDKTPYFRVLNATTNPFLDANTSYLHKSIGGQSPAKLWIYQDLIEHQISKNNRDVLDMLNTRYIISPDPATGQPVAQLNPQALGNAWFVKGIHWAVNANAEMSAMDHFNPADTVIIDRRFQSAIGAFTPAKDSSAGITLTKYGLNDLHFTSQNTGDGFAVFSDIYYPAGWRAYIDHQETDIIRVNYALRGLKIPAGKHDIVFEFRPKTFIVGRKIAAVSSWVLIGLVAGGLLWAGITGRKQGLHL